MLNPWPIIGGVASATLTAEEFIMPDGALAGDVVVLTKPLGTQVCVRERVQGGRGVDPLLRARTHTRTHTNTRRWR